MNSSDAEVWTSRMSLGLSFQTAPLEFSRIVGMGDLPACNPRGPNLKSIRVAFDLARDADHVLFKSPGDTHGRKNAMQGRAEDFLQDRADRLGWLPFVLSQPDAVYADKAKRGDYVYVCQTLPGEEFAVIVHEVYGRRSHFFITAYPLTQEEWKDKRRGFTKLWPQKTKKRGSP